MESIIVGQNVFLNDATNAFDKVAKADSNSIVPQPLISENLKNVKPKYISSGTQTAAVDAINTIVEQKFFTDRNYVKKLQNNQGFSNTQLTNQKFAQSYDTEKKQRTQVDDTVKYMDKTSNVSNTSSKIASDMIVASGVLSKNLKPSTPQSAFTLQLSDQVLKQNGTLDTFINKNINAVSKATTQLNFQNNV